RQNTMATLHQLRQLGVRIAMDDFGAGYCSLSFLRSFPFDKIKIDRAFIVDTIVRLGQCLGMATVAEGIDNFEQLKLVCATGCTEAQGLYFSAPVAVHDVERVLNDSFAHARNAA